jgi:hypothetical protein
VQQGHLRSIRDGDTAGVMMMMVMIGTGDDDDEDSDHDDG